MAFISTYYDKTLDDTGKPIGKVFMVRGEERYARTTDTTLIEHGERREDWDDSIRFFKLSLEAEVLRSMGESIISIYDNNDLLVSKDVTSTNSKAIWDYIDEEHDERLKLSYDVEHNLKAVFQGNKSCLKSESDLLTITVPTPAKYESNITITGAVEKPESEYPLQLVLMSDDTSIDIVLNADDYYSEQTVQLYEGNTLIAEAETNSNGEATFELVNPSSELHKYTVKYAGNDYLTSASTTVYTSVGYNVQVTDYPSVLINNIPGEVTVNVKDFFNISYEDINVKLVTTASSDITSYSSTDENGNVTFSDLLFNDTTVWKALTSHGDESSVCTTQIKTDVSLSIPNKITSVLNGETVKFDAQISERIAGVSVIFRLYLGGAYFPTYYPAETDKDGYANITYTGQGIGASKVAIDAINNELSYNFIDYVADFSKRIEYDVPSINSINGTITEAPHNILKITAPAGSKMYFLPKGGGSPEQTITGAFYNSSSTKLWVIIGCRFNTAQQQPQWLTFNTGFDMTGSFRIILQNDTITVATSGKTPKSFIIPSSAGRVYTMVGIGTEPSSRTTFQIAGLQARKEVDK